MTFLTLYILFLKATATSFAGLASLPVLRDELVLHRALLTDHRLNAAIVITRATPGPVGVYVVSVGYFAAGIVGALAAWLAMATPALGIIFLLRSIGQRAARPRVRGMIQTVVLASAALLVTSALPLAHDAITGPLTFGIAVVGLVAMTWKKVDSLWVIGAGALLSLASALVGLGA